jgi:hypothetical protein
MVMKKQILAPAAVTERKNSQTAYAAPRMFAVGTTAGLIQGRIKHGLLDGDGTMTKDYREILRPVRAL